jgi:hypothetical protein
MRKFVATTVIVASVCGVFGAREIWAENTTSHAVQKGDTLWDLSGGYLHDPLLWPKIWEINPRIANPHRITPGQVIKIPGRGSAPVREAREVAVVSDVVPVDSGPSPLARAGFASSSEPLPLVVVKKELPAAGEQARAAQANDPARYYDRGIGMVTKEIPNKGRVLRTEQGWQSAALGETILISAPGAQVGQQFGVYRDMGKVESLGYFERSSGHLLADIAIVEVVAVDASRQQAVIRRAYAEVRTDDLLGQVPEHPAVAVRTAQTGAVAAKGSVVAFHFMRQLAGPDDIVYLNIGADQGLAPGDLLSVAGADQTEGRNSGELMILRVSANTAAAVVTKRSTHEVRRGDVVGPPVL